MFRENNRPTILIKFDSHPQLVSACNIYNQRNPDSRFTVKKYYRIGNERYSSRDFKILDVPDSISNEQIVNAINNTLKRGNIFFRSRNAANDVYFYITDDTIIQMLKDTWVIIICDQFFRLTPAFYKRSEIMERNNSVSKFKNVSRNTNKSDIIDMFKAVGGKNFYWKDATQYPGDQNLYIEFQDESALISACNRTIQHKTITTIGIPRCSQWPLPNKDTSVNNTQSLQHIDHRASKNNKSNTSQNRKLMAASATGSNMIPISNSRFPQDTKRKLAVSDAKTATTNMNKDLNSENYISGINTNKDTNKPHSYTNVSKGSEGVLC